MTNMCSQSNTTENGEYEKDGSTQHLLMEVKRSCDNVSGSGEYQNTQQLLMQIKQSVDDMSAQLMTIKGGSQSYTTEREVHEKQQFVSALTGQWASINIVVAYFTVQQNLISFGNYIGRPKTMLNIISSNVVNYPLFSSV